MQSGDKLLSSPSPSPSMDNATACETSKSCVVSPSLIHALSEQHEKHVLGYEVFHPDNEVPVYTPEPENLFEMLTELLMARRISTYGR